MIRWIRKNAARITGKHHAFSKAYEEEEEAVEEEAVKEPSPVPVEYGRLAKESWSHLDASRFNVRQLGYAKNGKKAPSQEAFYRVVGIDIFMTDKREGELGGRGLVNAPEGALIINCQLPGQVGGWRSCADGAGHSVVLICELTEAGRARLESDEPAARLLSQFLEEAPGEPQEEPNLRGRFKVIAGVDDPKMLPSLIRSYNYKPALITKSGTFTKSDVYDMDISIFRFGYSSRSGLAMIAPNFKDYVINLAFVLEGRHDDQLPECLLAAAQLKHCGLHMGIPVGGVVTRCISTTPRFSEVDDDDEGGFESAWSSLFS